MRAVCPPCAGVRGRHTRLALGICAAVLALPTMTPAPAHAAVDFYYRGLCREGVTSCTFGGYYASYYKQSGYYQNIRAVLGWSDGSNHKIWISAHRFTGPYGSEVSGWGFVCHSYAANSDTRYALLVNRHSVAQNPTRGRIHLENPC